jgi:hypothetical protein
MKRKKKGQKHPTEKSLLRYLKESITNDFPNPKRIGCPKLNALQQNVRDPASANEAVSKHVGGCSPCYSVYSRLLRKEIARMRQDSSHRTRIANPRKKRLTFPK